VDSPGRAVRRVRRELARRSRSSAGFDARRYFRAAGDLRFHNIGMPAVRGTARTIYQEHRGAWSVADALAFAAALIKDPFLEAKAVGIEVLARYRGEFRPSLLAVWKRWLAGGHSSNWATTDEMCGALIGPLLVAHPELVAEVRRWSGHRNMWVRRASAVALIGPVRAGTALGAAYDVARRLQPDGEDLVQKAVGWMLREAGRADPARLERFLRANGPRTPRTTLRYAIERFPEATRQALLEATRSTPPESVGGRARRAKPKR
jgi:3-methyladenine DNA glycosylase AlkD